MNLKADKIEAKQIKVNVSENYEKVLTAIFNNWREDCRILDVRNNPEFGIYVTVRPQAVNGIADWLESFGEVEKIRDVLVYGVDMDYIDYDYEKYDDCIICAR